MRYRLWRLESITMRRCFREVWEYVQSNLCKANAQNFRRGTAYERSSLFQLYMVDFRTDLAVALDSLVLQDSAAALVCDRQFVQRCHAGSWRAVSAISSFVAAETVSELINRTETLDIEALLTTQDYRHDIHSRDGISHRTSSRILHCPTQNARPGLCLRSLDVLAEGLLALV
jgi:hypothetical protein